MVGWQAVGALATALLATSKLPGIAVWPPDARFTAHPEQDQWIDLPDGGTRYSMEGGSGPSVLYMHGYLLPKDGFDGVTPYLISRGYRVLRYDQWGRGYAEWPAHRPEGLDTFVSQARDLLDALGVKEPVNLVGYSWGAILASNFATRYPERVGRVALISPAGMPQEGSFAPDPEPVFLATWSQIASRAVSNMYLKQELASREHGFIQWQLEIAPEPLKAWMHLEKVERKVSELRNNGFAFKALGEAKEVLVLWAEKDRSVGPALLGLSKVRALMPRSACVQIKDSAHADWMEMSGHSEAIATALDSFIRAPSALSYLEILRGNQSKILNPWPLSMG